MVNFKQITDSVWAHTEGETFGHVAFIKLENSLVFVDSGYYPKIIKRARSKAEELTGLPVKYLLITHHHADHILGNQVFEDCEIISSKRVLENIEDTLRTQWTDEFLDNFRKKNEESFDILKVVLPNSTFENEYILKDEKITIKITETHGHTEGSSFIYIPEEEVIIAGDLLFSEEIPYFGDATSNPYLWIEAYQKIIDLKPKVVVPGHGPVTDLEQVKIQKKYMKDCICWMKNYIEEGGNKENLDHNSMFPMLDYELYDNFETLFNESKKQMYDEVMKKEFQKKRIQE